MSNTVVPVAIRPDTSFLISIVLPAHNEQENVAIIHDELRRVADAAGVAIEIIFVDDGSTDATVPRVRALAASDEQCRLIRLSRNFGHQAALLAGLSAAKGSAVITMDCDLQHPPEVLPEMIAAWRRGALVVQMNRAETVGASLFKRLGSSAFYTLMRVLGDRPLTLGPDFQLLDRQVVDTILRFESPRPFLRGLVAWVGFPSSQIEFTAKPREAGESSYSTGKMLGLAIDGITALSTKPLRLAAYLGIITAFLCACYAAFILGSYALGLAISGWTPVILAVLFLGSVQLLSIGIVGEYVGRIYELSRHVPPYLVFEERSRVSEGNRN